MIDDLPNDAKSKEVVRLWRAWRTVHEMVADRVWLSHPTVPRSLAYRILRKPLTDRVALFQEYELAEDEVTISLDRFRDEYCHPDGTVKYDQPFRLPSLS